MSRIGEISEAAGDKRQEREVAVVMARVGARVRALREARGVPRRVLSDLSGVSPRYLAQLEAGEGNISIGVLTRVALALETRVEHIVAQDRGMGDDRLLDMVARAGPKTRAAVLALLGGAPDAAGRAGRICLVGLRGAGKSTLGPLIGAALDLPFVELNRTIEDAAGMPVGEIMALYGAEGYRQLEADALDRVINGHERVVLAVAGGLVAAPDTYDRLLARCHTIWLRTSPEEHMTRVRAQGDERPMAGQPEAMAQLRGILKSREALYARAHAQLDTSGSSVMASRDEAVALIRAHGFAE